ncbi:hypothetical protein NVI2019_OHEONHNH_01883 [Providencia alcalifaciens]|nr:hypothetical protein [Providencia alcalifaciens]CAG9416750.1 hypothetical protein NVI2019_PLFLNFOB_01438 [Providencia alcalifaciens]CAG9420245.1 hypothetical protein NVI2019_OHEONHNH_01883 [Providencia alcalifaciens]CAG9424263.1 hypothetical protein NVI2019_KOLGMIGM_02379 [Providencia alcalifaciens]CAG9425267.1 hypothetical protein NVI2019_OGMBKCAO_02379 [Providencia alcalifaciens]CAG9425559.1 hypothetical protein NVI2019_ANGEOOBF_02378 [Providencia alcalifaciens]
MFLKISQKKCITAEYYPVKSVVTIITIKDGNFDSDDVVAKVKFNNETINIYKHQNAWLVNDDGVVLEVINRDYIWS